MDPHRHQILRDAFRKSARLNWWMMGMGFAISSFGFARSAFAIYQDRLGAPSNHDIAEIARVKIEEGKSVSKEELAALSRSRTHISDSLYYSILPTPGMALAGFAWKRRKTLSL